MNVRTRHRRGVDAARTAWRGLHLAAVGAGILALGAVLLVLALLRAMIGSDTAEDAQDPWGGQTLEWSTSSPPPPGNFTEPVPEVTSATPLVTTEEGGA